MWDNLAWRPTNHFIVMQQQYRKSKKENEALSNGPESRIFAKKEDLIFSKGNEF